MALLALLFSYVQTNDVGVTAPLLDQVGGGWFACALLASAALLGRRSRPVIVAVVVVVVDGVLAGAGQVPLLAPVVVVTYTLVVHRSLRAAIFAAAATVAVQAGLALATGQPFGSAGLQLVALVIAVLAGANVAGRRRYVEALIERAAQLARDRDREASLAAAAERSRIARELHDIVAHSLSVIVRLSDGADAVAVADPGHARDAVRQIGTVARESLTDMRRLLGVLRDGDAPPKALAPAPTLDRLDELVAGYRTAGLPVTLRRRGPEPTSEAVQQVLYRTAQEALTNALRHATSPTTVEVSLVCTPDLVEVEVTDDGATPAQASSAGPGRGLLGMRERATAFGGHTDAGPHTDGRPGWRVRLSLPGDDLPVTPSTDRCPPAAAVEAP